MHLGFGFDGKGKTYKVVKLLFLSFYGDDSDGRIGSAEVYTLSSGCWRFLPFGGEVRDVEVCSWENISIYTHDGVFPWFAYETNEDMAVLLFDMGVDVFSDTTAEKV